MEVQERAPSFPSLSSPHFLVTNDFASLRPNGLFRGEIATLAHSLSLSLSTPPARWSKMSCCDFRRLVPIITSFGDDNFLSAAAGSVTAAQLETSSASFPGFLRIFDRATLRASEGRGDEMGISVEYSKNHVGIGDLVAQSAMLLGQR